MKTAFLLFIAFFNLAHADDSVNAASLFSGRVFTDQYARLNKDTANTDTIAQSNFTAWLELNTHREDNLNAHLVAAQSLFFKSMEYPKTVRGTLKLREGYVSYSNQSLEAKLGQQIIPWGKSDGVNPTDYFTAKDYTVYNPDDEVRRQGAPGASLSYTPSEGASPLNFTAVVQGNYPRARLLIPDSSIPTGINFEKYPSDRFLVSANTTEFGFKIAYLKSDYDFSVSAFRGFAQMPHYEFNGTKIYSVNSRETAFGGDASFTAGDYIIRFESAFHFPDDGKNTDMRYGLVEPWHWDSVVGAERPLWTDFRLQLQVLYRYHFYYQSPDSYHFVLPLVTGLQRSIGKANALMLNYLERGTPGATFRFGYQPENGDFSADLFFMGYFGSKNDFALRPQVGYKAMEGLKLALGADIYGGAENRPLGSLKHFSVAFFEAKYVF